jgi:hypothetical protein
MSETSTLIFMQEHNYARGTDRAANATRNRNSYSDPARGSRRHAVICGFSFLQKEAP